MSAAQQVGQYEGEWEAPISTLRVTVDRLDLVSSWKRCGLVADFVARYVSDHFRDPQRVGLVLSTVFNELVENAVKFSLPGSHEVRLAVPFWGHRLTLELRHSCTSEQADRLATWIARLEAHDAEDLFVEQLEHTAAHAPETSGLGLITLRKDYDAGLGVRLLPFDDDVVKVALQVHLPSDALEA